MQGKPVEGGIVVLENQTGRSVFINKGQNVKEDYYPVHLETGLCGVEVGNGCYEIKKDEVIILTSSEMSTGDNYDENNFYLRLDSKDNPKFTNVAIYISGSKGNFKHRLIQIAPEFPDRAIVKDSLLNNIKSLSLDVKK